MQTFRSIAFTLTLCLALFVAAGAQVTKPHTFADGETIDAARMNANFDEIYSKALNRTGGTMTGTLETGTLTATTLNGFTFDQSVASGASPTFNAITATTLNTYTFNQSVASGASPTFGAGNITGVLEANITDGSILARLAANETISGTWSFSNGLRMPTGQGLWLDGGTDTYIWESAANTVQIVTGASAAATFNSVGALTLAGSLTIPSASVVYLDGGSDTYISEQSANVVAVVVNNATAAQFGTTGASIIGRVQANAQPGFLAYKSSAQSSVSDNTTVTFDTESYDTASNFASSTFTAPVTGFYQFCAGVTYSDGASDDVGINISISGTQYRIDLHGNSNGAGALSGCTQMVMGIGETAFVVTELGVAEAIDISGQAGSPRLTWFSGRLMP